MVDGGDETTADDADGKTNGQMESNSPSPAMEIEGIVTGEPDTGIVQSGGNVPIDNADTAISHNNAIDTGAPEVHNNFFLFQ